MKQVNEKIIIAGYGGQGAISLGYIIAYSAMLDNFQVSHFPSYGAEMRGGTANCSVVISNSEIPSPVFAKPTSAIIMNSPSLSKFINRIEKNGILILNEDMINDIPKNNSLKIISVNANKNAEKLGSLKAANILLAGVWNGIINLISFESFKKTIIQFFKKKYEEIIKINLNAFEFGLKLSEKFK
jgi:2-oxoglutarate ferredoxin oxidoreductase subunit gamma